MPEPEETWGPGRKSLAYMVKLKGAEVQKTLQTSGGTSVRRYVVDRVEVTTRWSIGQEEEGRTTVRLDCREIIGGQATYVHHTFHPDDLDEVPLWLGMLETRASPRDVG